MHVTSNQQYILTSVMGKTHIRRPIIDIWDKEEEIEYMYDWLSDRYRIYNCHNDKRGREREKERERNKMRTHMCYRKLK